MSSTGPSPGATDLPVIILQQQAQDQRRREPGHGGELAEIEISWVSRTPPAISPIPKNICALPGARIFTFFSAGTP